jgi:hypothetical protein
MAEITIPTTKKLMVPTVHLNGTSKMSLLEGYETAYNAVKLAIDALVDTAPHGRDYYVEADDAYSKARDQYLDRLRKLEEVQRDLEELYRAVLET